MRLVGSLLYVDSARIRWPVPNGAIVDGASIPRVFWIAWAPFTGKYREASIVHDYYCRKRNRHWKAVHRMFYDGMLASGVDPLQARAFYIAVYRFGPRWDFDADACFCKGCPVCANPMMQRVEFHKPRMNRSDARALHKKLGDTSLTLEELEAMADYQFNTEIFRSGRN